MRWLLALGAIAAMFVLACLTVGEARDNGQYQNVNPRLKEWVRGLHNKMGHNCCDEADGADVAWGIEGEKYWVVLDDVKRVVPDDAVLEGPNLLGHARVWTYPSLGLDGKSTPVIRCFIPGAGG